LRGVNGTLDNVIGPLNVAAEYVDRISKGDIPPKITDEYNGDFNEIKNNLNQAIDAVALLVTDAKMLARAAKEGKLDTRADASRHNGDFREVVEGVNGTLDNVIGPLNVAAEYVDRISKGDIPPKITDEYNGDFNEIKNNLNQAIDAVALLVTDAKMLARAAKEGKLDTRADASRHNGDFREVVEGVNGTLDNVIGPLNVAAEYMDRISKGDLPDEITDNYNGDFNEIKNNINQLIHNLNAFIREMKNMSDEHDLGQIDVMIDVNRFTGFYTEMARGVNGMVDGHINVKKMAMGVFKEYGKGNFDANIERLPGQKVFINETIDAVQDNLKMIAQEIKDLIKKSVAGELSYRGDAAKYDGDWREMVEGINEMIDALLDPVNEAGQVLEVMATGDLRVRMKGHYQGDNENLKKNINLLGDSLSHLIMQVNESVHSSASSASEISATSDSLAASTQEQSAQADEVASAVEQMSRTVTDNAMSANRTSEVANENGAIAKEGASVVEQTVTKMRDIAKVVKDSAGNIQKLGDSSKQIGEIISVIDDIADQTNLLALNAAIEAARAGEQGRGFAVVADEVRKLAERTTEATKQIATMIKGIQKETDAAVVAMNEGTNEVNNGIELADKAGTSLNKILESTQEVIDMINQIAAASEEQSATSEQISKNVVSISKVTAESAQRVEDVSKTANELARATEDLSILMQKFKVDETLQMLEDKDDLRISNSRGNSRHLTA
jgi:methyl-accepting chemotaxis protein